MRTQHCHACGFYYQILPDNENVKFICAHAHNFPTSCFFFFNFISRHLVPIQTPPEINSLGLLYRAHQVLHRLAEEIIKAFLPFLLGFSATLLTLTLSVLILYSDHFTVMLKAELGLVVLLDMILVGLGLEMGYGLTVASTNFIESFKHGLRPTVQGNHSEKLRKCYGRSFVGLKWHIAGVLVVHRKSFIIFMNKAVIDNVISIVLAFQN